MNNEDNQKAVCKEVISKLTEDSDKKLDINKLKLESSKRYKLELLPKNSEILSLASSADFQKLLPSLQLKKVRSISGVNIISVMSHPRECPHGRCAYCPLVEGVPSSYTGKEPAAMRGIQNEFDPYNQVRGRLNQLKAIGHSINKIELIIQGGTFPASPIEYQRSFIKGCLDAITNEPSSSLEDAMNKATKSQNKNVGITLETRPDYATKNEVDNMLSMGVTRVEVGVQNLYDDVYDLIERGHDLEAVTKAFQLLKDSGLKIVAHMMPGLPGSNPQRDLEAFQQLFNDSAFKPDMLKIYPCLVLEGTKLYEWWLKGSYRPYELEQTIDLIVKIKNMVPPWIRIMRIQRDIPAQLIVAGVKKGNLREIVLNKMNERGLTCNCIRCREVGHRLIKGEKMPEPADLKIVTRTYDASDGQEIFLSIENPNSGCLIGYTRLRIPSENAHRKEIVGKNAGLIREIHVLGPLVPVGETDPLLWQHRGFGSTLLNKAEEMAKTDYDCKKILVTSALGSRKYFMKLGYSLDGPYMSKKFER
ncbi:tRNA uridine(34) 5-carboxymethylaminomethyl modification radical SAM/GNAT enzyme Elp3 [[Eubacterium] cellulosolvens]